MSDYTGENTLIRTLPSDRCTVQLATCKKGGIHVSQHTHTHILAKFKNSKIWGKKERKNLSATTDGHWTVRFTSMVRPCCHAWIHCLFTAHGCFDMVVSSFAKCTLDSKILKIIIQDSICGSVLWIPLFLRVSGALVWLFDSILNAQCCVPSLAALQPCVMVVAEDERYPEEGC